MKDLSVRGPKQIAQFSGDVGRSGDGDRDFSLTPAESFHLDGLDLELPARGGVSGHLHKGGVAGQVGSSICNKE